MTTTIDASTNTCTTQTRYATGLNILRQVGGENFDGPINSLQAISPDMARFTVEFGYGEVMSRPGLDLKTRQLCTVAALTAMGNAQPQLKYHINGALNVGWTGPEVIEAILLSAVYAGFPAALNGVFAAKEVFQSRGMVLEPKQSASGSEMGEPNDPVNTTDRYARGLRALQQVTGACGTDVIQSLKDIAPDLARFIIEFSYGDIISRPGLDNRSREIASVALLTTLATVRPQLKVHLHAALNVGATRMELTEAILQMALYAGFPAGLNGMAAAREVFEQAALM